MSTTTRGGERVQRMATVTALADECGKAVVEIMNARRGATRATVPAGCDAILIVFAWSAEDDDEDAAHVLRATTDEFGVMGEVLAVAGDAVRAAHLKMQGR